jgi:hypothetical protein
MVFMQRLRAVGPVVLLAAALCLGTRTAAANAATLPTPTLAFSTPPSAAVGSAGYTLATSTNTSDQAASFTVDPITTSSACSITGNVLSFAHAGTCVVDAQTSGDANYGPASATQTTTVTAAGTATDLVVGTTALTATVSAAAPGGGTPSGSVVFSVGGRVLGTSTLAGGVATLAYSVPPNVTEAILASFQGSSDYTTSSATVTVNGPDIEPTFVARPTIAAAVTSAEPKNKHGWWHTTVRVHFICNAAGSKIIGGCPSTVALSHSGDDLTVTRTIRTVAGATATVTLRGIKLDLSKPRVELVGIRNRAMYHGSRPPVSCAASDSISGIRSCRVVTTVKRSSTLETVTYTATATSWAGLTQRAVETVYAKV